MSASASTYRSSSRTRSSGPWAKRSGSATVGLRLGLPPIGKFAPMLRLTTPFVALALAASVLAPASAAPRSDGPSDGPSAGRSAPVEDSYYPGKGDPGVDALHYGLDLTWLKKRRVLKGVARITLRATANDNHFQLDLGDPLRVRSVHVNGRRAGFRHPGKTLRVNRDVVRNHRYRVRVVYRGTPRSTKAPTTRRDMRRVGWTTTRNGQVWTMQEPFGAFTWYPSNDQPSDKALYDVRISAPGRWVGVSNGQLRQRRYAKGRTVTRWRLDQPASTYLMTIAIGPYTQHRQRGPRGIPMSYWVPTNRPGLVKPLMRTPAAMRFLERRLGRYPFDRVGVVLVPSDSAMETQEMVTFGIGNYDFGPTTVQDIMVHELAHHWYGNTVTPRDWRDVWMNEGMATYLEARWTVKQGDFTWRNHQRYWRQSDQQFRNRYGPPGRYNRGMFAEANVYYSSALMLDELRQMLGDARFNRLMRQWPQTHRDSNQSRASYVGWLEARTGRNLDPFFEKWLMSRTSPVV